MNNLFGYAEEGETLETVVQRQSSEIVELKGKLQRAEAEANISPKVVENVEKPSSNGGVSLKDIGEYVDTKLDARLTKFQTDLLGSINDQLKVLTEKKEEKVEVDPKEKEIAELTKARDEAEAKIAALKEGNRGEDRTKVPGLTTEQVKVDPKEAFASMDGNQKLEFLQNMSFDEQLKFTENLFGAVGIGGSTNG